jgi:hypothetical protein
MGVARRHHEPAVVELIRARKTAVVKYANESVALAVLVARNLPDQHILATT